MSTEQHYRIVFIDYVVSPGLHGRSGLSDIVWDMASVLTDMGHDVHIISSYSSTFYPDARISVHPIKIPPMGLRNVAGHIWLLRRAATMAKHLDMDIIHMPEYLSSAVFIGMKVNVPIVVSVPGNIYHRLSVREGSNYEWHYTQVLKWAAKRTARHSSRIIAISHDMKSWWQKIGSRPQETIWIPLGVNIERFQWIHDARDKLNIPTNLVNFLYVGRFSKEKGILHFLDAIRKTADYSRNFRVYFIGGGVLRDELVRRIHLMELNDICYVLPWVSQDQLSLWYSAADALVLPSYTEAMARAMGEALACGTPVIGSDIMGVADHIRNGFNGYKYPSKNTEQLSHILTTVIDQPYMLRDLRDNSKHYAKIQLSWQSVCEEVVQKVYFPILSP